MSVISLRLSESVHKEAAKLAERESISLNQLISTALAEKLSTLATEDILTARAKQASQAAFQKAMDQVPDQHDDRDGPANPNTTDDILNRQSEAVKRYVNELDRVLRDDDIEQFSTMTQGGDLRYRHIQNGIFAEIKFFRSIDCIDLRLYFPPDFVPGDVYKLYGRNNKQSKYDIRLDVHKSIPEHIKQHIVISRQFIRKKR